MHAVHASREHLVRTTRWRNFGVDKVALIKQLIREDIQAAVAAAMRTGMRAA